MPQASWTLLTDALFHRALAAGGGSDARSSDDYATVFAEAREAFAEALAGGSPFAGLVRRAGLTAPEAEVFAALCAVELDPGRQRAVGRLADDAGQRRLSLHLVGTLFGPDHAGPLTLAPDSLLVRSGLVDVANGATWATRLAGPATRVTWHLVGDDSLDPQLPLDLEIVGRADEDRADDLADDARGHLVFVTGTDRIRCMHAAVEHTRGDVFLSAREPSTPETWMALVREATISDAGIILRAEDELSLVARHWIERTPHLSWAVTAATPLPLDGFPRRPWVEVAADPPHAHADELAALLDDAGADEELSIDARRLTAHQLQLVAGAAQAVGGVGAAVRRLAAGRIEKLSRRVRPAVGWDDLVLPPDQLTQLRELTQRYRHRSIVHDTWGARAFPSPGLVALFSGPSGTGKTTAAEVLAADLGVDLFKIDVSAVVSKYIGETEKNLEELFSAAGTGDLVLCFDEADALLGKRSEVNDARDRYANIEVSYLLQRLETYEGFVVLTTNLQSNIDEAFLRRLHARVAFPTPGPSERRTMWERALRGIPTEGLDLDGVAQRFDLVGGAIRNAALAGAFMAATEGTPLTQALLIRSLKREYQKHGRLITRDLFGEWFDLATIS